MPDDNVIPMRRPQQRTVAPIAPDTLSRIYHRPPRELPKVIPFAPIALAPSPRFRWTGKFGFLVASSAALYFIGQMIRAHLAGHL